VDRRVIGGLMMRVAGRLFPTSVRLEELPAPACWRCSRQLFFGAAELAVGDESHPWVWVCPGCLTDDDIAAREKDERA
jgi:hypothetical protein